MRAIFALLLILLAARLDAQERRSALDRLIAPVKSELSKEQSAKIDVLIERLDKQRREIQRELGGVFTDEQRRAMQQALSAARDAGKNIREARAAGNAAAKLTAEQQAKLDELTKRRNDLTAKTQAELVALLTPQQRSKLRGPGNQPNRAPVEPTHADLKYGPAARNVMDVWLAESDKPTPVLVSIHGGGFRGGRKSISAGLLRQCLDEGISAVAITYRLSDEAIAPAQMLDSARAIQFIRHNAKAWNIDSERIAATGGSAGAGISLWLGFHDDLADPDNDDPCSGSQLG